MLGNAITADDFDREFADLQSQLSELRAGPLGQKILSGLDRMKDEGGVSYGKF